MEKITKNAFLNDRVDYSGYTCWGDCLCDSGFLVVVEE